MGQFRVLIVDDHEVSRRGIRSLLIPKTDWIIGEAADGIEAIDKANIFRPDIVVMDVSMPKMNGLDATRVLGRELPNSKVVIVSQNDPDITRRQADAVHAAAYIPKCDVFQDLLPTLHRLMGRGNLAPVPASKK